MSSSRPVLIFGGDGQVGQALVRHAKSRAAIGLGRDVADLTDAGAVDAALDRHHPDLVLNAAVFQPVDLCESEVRQAFEVNAAGAGRLAAACARRGVRMIHISTDYVFDGGQRTPYTEEDCPRPLNVYAASKLAGENLVLNAGDRHQVVRTSSVYGRALPGRGTQPFVESMLQRALDAKPTRVVNDQFVSPTYVEDLAVALWELSETDAAGIVHMAGSSEASWYDVAERVFAAADRLDLLEPTTAAEFGAAAPRPEYTALTSVRLTDLGIDPLPGFEDGLDRHLRTAHPELFAG